MALQTSGMICMDDIKAEFGSTSNCLADYYAGGGIVSAATAPNVPTSGQICMSNFYGASQGSSGPQLSISSSFEVGNGPGQNNQDTQLVTATGLSTSGSYNLVTPTPTVTSGSLLCEFNSFFHSMTHIGGGTWTASVRLDRTGGTTGTGISTFEVKQGFSSLSPALTLSVGCIQNN